MNRLKELRLERNLTMRETAQQLKIPYTTYVNYEKGTREPNSEMLINLATFFDVSIDYLLGRNKISSVENDSKVIGVDAYKDITDIEKNMLCKYRKLNPLGKAKADEYITDLSEQKKYTAAKRIKPTELDYEIAAWGADGTKGTYKAPEEEVT